MRTFGKILAALVALLLVVATAAVAFGVWTARRSFPQTTGTITLSGLTAPVEVIRDGWGVPQIYADSAEDLFFAQGYVQAQDRMWQMDFNRHVTSGRLSEMFGKSQIDTDTYLRTMGWRRVAELEVALLTPPAKVALDSYSAGVNAYLADHSGASASLEYAVLALQNSGYTIEPWSAVDSLAWGKAIAWDLRGNMDDEIARVLSASTVGVARAEQLFPAYPYARHRPIVDQGGLVGKTFDQNASGSELQSAAAARSVPGLATSLASIAAGAKAVDALIGPTGTGIGSNSWAVAGSKTSTGKALLANDPHLGPQMPSVWYQQGLHCRAVGPACAYNVAGFGFPGLPGVLTGHNDKISWGVTNLGPDVTDLVLEQVQGDGYLVDGKVKPFTTREEVIKVAGADPVSLTVRTTEHGPLMSPVSAQLTTVGKDAPVPPPGAASTREAAPPRGDGYAVALEWTALTPGTTVNAVVGFMLAQSIDQFREAASHFDVPAQNLLVADSDGTIAYQSPGKIPVRAGYNGQWPVPGWDSRYRWTGFVPFASLPFVKNPPEGWIVTANQAVINPDRYPLWLTSDWNYGFRSQRIVERIKAATDGGKKMTPLEMRQIQLDKWNEMAAFVVPKLASIPKDGFTAQAAALFDGWDFTQPEDSAPAAYFNAFWSHLLTNTVDTQLPADAAANGGSRWFEFFMTLWDKPTDPWWDDKSTPAVETRDTAVANALTAGANELRDRLGSEPATWTWGALHTLLVKNPSLGDSGIKPIEALFNRGPVSIGGGESVVQATGWNATKGYQVSWVPSYRMVIDWSDLDQSSWMHLTGASGHAFSAHYDDQLYELWAQDKTVQWPWTRTAVLAAAADTLTLAPAS
jgi:penicillin amidase